MAEYRSNARKMYHNLLTPSCGKQGDPLRSIVMQQELGKVADYERRVAKTQLSVQLRLARSDAENEIRSDKHCWVDDQPTFAKMHTTMAKNAAASALNALAATEAKRETSFDKALIDRIDSGAEFRRHSRRLSGLLHPMCRLSSKDEDEQILSIAAYAVHDFRKSLDSWSATLFDLAEADVLQDQSDIVVECAEPSDQSLAALQNAALAEAKAEISLARESMTSK